METPKPKMGPPFKAPEDLMVKKSVNMLAPHWVEFEDLGGVKWLREEMAKSIARKMRALKKQKPPEGGS